MRLDLTVYGVLLAGGLAAAYWASLPVEAGDAEDKVKIVSIESSQIAKITLSTTDKVSGAIVDATLTRQEGGERYWIDHTKTEPAKETPADPHAAKPEDKAAEAPAATAEAKPPKITSDRFLGNEKAEEFVKSLDPLVAVRVIGKADDKQMEEFGLKGQTNKLTVTTKDGKAFALIIGKQSYGSRNRFVLEAGEGSQGRVLLLEDEGLENLERAPLRLYDRRIVGFEVADVDKATVTFGGQAKRLAHTVRDKGGEILWTEDEENATAKPTYDSWMDKVAKLRLTTYAKDADEQALKATAPFLEIAFEKNGKAVDTLRFKKLVGDKTTYWVTSDFLKGHADVVPARIEPLEKDAPQIVKDDKS